MERTTLDVFHMVLNNPYGTSHGPQAGEVWLYNKVFNRVAKLEELPGRESEKEWGDTRF